MRKEIALKDNEYFTYDDLCLYEKKGDFTVIALTGARGAGKTESLRKMIQHRFQKGEVGLYLRNDKLALSTARTYFSVLADDHHNIELGRPPFGAGSVALFPDKTLKDEEPRLIAYTLALSDYDRFKSSKKKVQYVIYEEFTNLNSLVQINRAFSFVEILETARQGYPNISVYACANNLVRDTLFEWLFDEKDYLELAITKSVRKAKSLYRSPAIENYLNGGVLVDTPVLDISSYQCNGYYQLGTEKVYLYTNKLRLPIYVLSDKGNQKKLTLNANAIRVLKMAAYKSLDVRNKLEFSVGLAINAYKRVGLI